MAEIALSVVGKITEYTIDPILCQFKYMFCYNSKIQTLRDTVDGLEIKEYDVQQLVVEAERNAEAIKHGVIDWLQKVDSLKNQAYVILESAKNSKMQCLFLTCPNLKTRHSLGRKATKKTAEVAKLQVEGGTIQRVGETKPLVQTPYQKPGDFGAFETRILTKMEITKALKDKDISIIGICGMPGVGKTTMANEIAKEVNNNELFDEVAMAVVSQDPDVIKIQGQLAEMLGLKIEAEARYNKNVRAERLCERLRGNRGKGILIILDDVWEDIDLGAIGIPSAGVDKMLKVLLTSRNYNVCTNMGSQRIFDINVLSEEESWELFKEKAEISDDATYVIKCTAKKVASECGGLPLALVTIGSALRKKPEYEWENALEELQNSSATNIGEVQKLVNSIVFSIDRVSGEARSLLLRFSLFPEDHIIAIEGLVRYAYGLKLFRGTETLRNTRNRVNTIVNILKSRYLLRSAESKDGEGVKLHDVVRDVCLQIASKYNKHAYLSKHTGLKDWPKDNNNELYSAISLTSNELNQLPGGLEYPNLEFLRLKVELEEQSLNISPEFFADMKELRVLDFTSMRIQIPSSIRQLTNLQTLCLNRCTLGIENSTIGNLKKLEVLSFFGSILDHFPSDIAELCNLRLLDLRSYNSCPLPRGILLKLKKLEELYMGYIKIRDDDLEQPGYIIEEITSLTGLNTFQISTNNPQFLLHILHVLCIEKLERFNIRLNDPKYYSEIDMLHYYFSRRLHIRGGITYASMLLEPTFNSLMWRAEHLLIDTYDNMHGEVDFEYLNGNYPTGAFDGLQAFARLQVISLSGMQRMKHLWRGVIKPYGSFHNLMFLNISSCHSVKSLFSESVALCMVNLQCIGIYFCDMLEEVVSTDMEQNEVTQMLEFSKLQEIYLYDLRSFKTFRSGSNKLVGVHNPLFNQITFPNLERLTISKLGCIVKMFDELRQISSHKLRTLDVECLDYVSILFDFEYTEDDAEVSILSQLISLEMSHLPKLVHITRMFPRGNYIFENLTNLTVSNCENLSYLFSPSMASSLVALKHMDVSHCKTLEEIIRRQEEDNTFNIEIVEEAMTSRIMFPKLSSITLYHLDRFRLLSSQNYELVFPSLKYLRIEKCPVMTKFCSRQSAPKLDKVWINSGQTVDISNFMDSEGSIHIREEDKVVDTSNIDEDTCFHPRALKMS